MRNTAVYSVEVGDVGEAVWNRLLPRFSDATIYQTWAYGSVRWGAKNLSHLVLKKNGQVVGAAQAAIKVLPIAEAGIAHIPWGPVWKLRGRPVDGTNYSIMCRALREEYAVKRGLFVRITPNELESDVPGLCRSTYNYGFTLSGSPYRTLLIDLFPPMADLLKRASRRWRRALKAAESNGLEVAQGTDNRLFDVLVRLYEEMAARKGFVPGFDLDEFARIQEALPPRMKMQIMVAKVKSEPVAALAASLVGEKGMGLVGATGMAGLGLGSFQLLNMRMMEWLKGQGARWYDFGGYDPEKHPGTAFFKDALPRLDVTHVGQFECCVNGFSELSVKLGEYALNAWRAGRVGRSVPNLITGWKKQLLDRASGDFR